MRFSPSGDRVMVFTPGGTCSGHFDTATGASLPVPAKGAFVRVINDVGWLDHTRIVGAVTAFALRAAARSEERLVLWDAPTGNLLRWERNVSVIQCVAPAPDGRTFAEAGDDRMIRLRDAETLAVQGAFRAHDASITALAWHPTRPLLASASSDLTIKLWEIPGGRLLEELRGPVKPVTALHFSPGGGRLISAGTDQTRVWEPKALRPGVGATQ